MPPGKFSFNAYMPPVQSAVMFSGQGRFLQVKLNANLKESPEAAHMVTLPGQNFWITIKCKGVEPIKAMARISDDAKGAVMVSGDGDLLQSKVKFDIIAYPDGVRVISITGQPLRVTVESVTESNDEAEKKAKGIPVTSHRRGAAKRRNQ